MPIIGQVFTCLFNNTKINPPTHFCPDKICGRLSERIPILNSIHIPMLTQGITIKPGKNFADGITTADAGKPDFNRAMEQHEAYCKALQACGIEVLVLEADERFPDGCFIEDTAIVTEEVAIITRPGDPRRFGEQERVREILARHKKTEQIIPPGNIEGGDVMRVGDHFYIGISRRTNEGGARQLAKILSSHGYSSSTIPVETVLHLKTGVTSLCDGSYISIPEFSNRFSGATVIELEKEEYYTANCLLVNDRLLVPKGYPNAKEKLLGLGCEIVELEMSEFMKMDGGLTCLSLLF